MAEVEPAGIVTDVTGGPPEVAANTPPGELDCSETVRSAGASTGSPAHGSAAKPQFSRATVTGPRVVLAPAWPDTAGDVTASSLAGRGWNDQELISAVSLFEPLPLAAVRPTQAWPLASPKVCPEVEGKRDSDGHVCAVEVDLQFSAERPEGRRVDDRDGVRAAAGDPADAGGLAGADGVLKLALGWPALPPVWMLT